MLSPSNRAFIGLAVAALALTLAVFFIPDSAKDGGQDGLTENQTSDEMEAGQDSVAKKVDAVPAPAQLADPSRSSVDESGESIVFDPKLATLQVLVSDLAGVNLAGVEVLVLLEKFRDPHGPFPAPLDRLLRHPEVANISARTDTTGLALLGNLPVYSELDGLIRGEGLTAIEFEFHTKGAEDPIQLGPVPIGASINASITLVEKNGTPVPGVELGIGVQDIPEQYSKEFPPIDDEDAATDGNGVAHFNLLPVDPNAHYGYSGRVINRDSKFDNIGMPTPSDFHIRITVPDYIWAQGRVIDSDGHPVQNAHISMQWIDKYDLPDDGPVEQVLNHGPGNLWNSHSKISYYTSDYRTGADGNFRARIPQRSSNWSDKTLPDFVAATVLIGDYFALSTNWVPLDHDFQIVIPAHYRATGRVVDEQLQPIAGARVLFHERLGPGETPATNDEHNWQQRSEVKPTPCSADGSYTKDLLPTYYWIEVLLPGGRQRFEGPFHVTSPLEIPDLIITNGRSVRLIAKAINTKRPILDLKASSGLQPSEDRTERGDRREQLTPWGEEDYAWTGVNKAAKITTTTASWTRVPDGNWRFLLQAPGFAPTYIDLDLTAKDGDYEQVVELVEMGSAQVEVQLASGEPATDIVLVASAVENSLLDGLFKELDDTSRYYGDEKFQSRPNEEGIAYFKELIPGEYQLVSTEETVGLTRFLIENQKRDPIATFTVASGQTAVVKTSLAQMAELRVWVSYDGQLISGAEIFSMDQEGADRMSWYLTHQEPAGKTGEDGSFSLSSLAPDKAYLIGARMPSTSKGYGAKEAWTFKTIQLGPGTQEVTVELPTGGVRFKVRGTDLIDEVEAYVWQVEQTPALAADADQDQRSSWEWDQVMNKIEPLTWQRISNEVVQREVTLNQTVEIANLPPGVYRITAGIDTDDRSAWVHSDEFTIGRTIFDVGELELIEIYLTKMQVFGLDSLDEDTRDDLDLFCFPMGSPRAIEKESWIGDGRPEEWMLPAGVYELALYMDHKEVARSNPIEVQPIEENLMHWTVEKLTPK